MGEPAGRIPRPRLELSLTEARTRFVQLARLASLTGQTTLVTDAGRPLAAIVPARGLEGSGGGSAAPDASGPGARDASGPGAWGPSGPGAQGASGPGAQGASGPGGGGASGPGGGGASGPGDGGASGPDAGGSEAAAGWVRRIESLRAEFQRQHGVLEEALERVWEELDKVRPPGSDSAVDALRLSHADIRRSR